MVNISSLYFLQFCLLWLSKKEQSRLPEGCYQSKLCLNYTAVSQSGPPHAMLHWCRNSCKVLSALKLTFFFRRLTFLTKITFSLTLTKKTSLWLFILKSQTWQAISQTVYYALVVPWFPQQKHTLTERLKKGLSLLKGQPLSTDCTQPSSSLCEKKECGSCLIGQARSPGK